MNESQREDTRTETVRPQSTGRSTRNSGDAGLGNVNEYLPTRKPRKNKTRPVQRQPSESDIEDTHFQTAREEDIAAALGSSILGGEETIDLNPNPLNLFDQLPFSTDDMVGGGAQGGRSGSRAGSEAGGAAGGRKNTKSMPAAYSGKHPMYDPANPSTATRFFDGVEMAAQVAGLTGQDEEIVKNALSYLDTPTSRMWGRLKGGYDPYNFKEWRKAVMGILPKASRFDVGSMARLDDICRKARERPIGRDEKSAFYEFALGFQAEAEPLLESGVIANLDLVVKFIGGLKQVFREALNERLSRKPAAVDGAARDEEDPFTLDDVIKTATAMVDAAAVGPFGALSYVEEEVEYARNATSGGFSERSESAGLKELKVKQETMSEDMAKVFTTLDRVEKSVSLLTTQFDHIS